MEHVDGVDDYVILSMYFQAKCKALRAARGIPPEFAIMEAARITAAKARHGGFTWSSLRAAFVDYPDVLSIIPMGDGPICQLPMGSSKHAVLASGRVERQGEFFLDAPPQSRRKA